MALYRGGRVRTRGGRGRDFYQDSSYPAYKRSDQNVFEVLSSLPQDGDSLCPIDGGLDAEGFSCVRKRQRVSTGGSAREQNPQTIYDDISDSNFNDMSVDEKLTTIFSALTCNQNKITHVEQKVDSIIRLNGRVARVETIVSSYNDRLKLLEYKSIDIEARSRRNNLLFRGLPEIRDEDCRKTICDFLESKLDMDELPGIERAHRLGKFNRLKGPRPIIVAFSFYRDTDDVISLARVLKGTTYSINRDYPLEITNARKTLWPQFKEARSIPYNRVTIGYPAKLIVNGVVTWDLFPDWDNILRGSRISAISVNDERQNVTVRPSYASVTALRSTQASSVVITDSDLADSNNNALLTNQPATNNPELMDTQDPNSPDSLFRSPSLISNEISGGNFASESNSFENNECADQNVHKTSLNGSHRLLQNDNDNVVQPVQGSIAQHNLDEQQNDSANIPGALCEEPERNANNQNLKIHGPNHISTATPRDKSPIKAQAPSTTRQVSEFYLPPRDLAESLLKSPMGDSTETPASQKKADKNTRVSRNQQRSRPLSKSRSVSCKSRNTKPPSRGNSQTSRDVSDAK